MWNALDLRSMKSYPGYIIRIDYMSKEICPVCEGYGKILMPVYEGDLKIRRDVECNCWACRGTKFVEYNRDVEFTDSTLKSIIDSTRYH